MSLTGEELSSLVSLTEKSQDHSDVAPSLESLSHSFLQEIRFEILPDLDVYERGSFFDPLQCVKKAFTDFNGSKIGLNRTICYSAVLI